MAPLQDVAVVQPRSAVCRRRSLRLAPRLSYGLSHNGVDLTYGGKRRRQATAQAERQMHATDVCKRTHKLQLSARCSVYGEVSRREDKSSKWLQPASLPKKTIIWCCFAAGVDTAMYQGQQKKNNGFDLNQLLIIVVLDISEF